MPIYRIDPDGLNAAPGRWDLDEATVGGLPTIDDYPRATADLVARSRRLAAVPLAHLVQFLSSFAERWLDERPDELRRAAPPGAAYGLAFLRRTNLERLLHDSLRGSPAALDAPVAAPGGSGRVVAAVPRGLVTHWVAGNVPVLGWLSLVQGLLAKNANVVKLPSRSGLVLPWYLRHLLGHECRAADGTGLSGTDVAGAVLLVYSPPADVAAHSALSAASDARIIWGGREAVAAIRSLPARGDVEDLVFGPRLSLAVIGREALNPEGLESLAGRVALDASAFDQRGCNSPHTVFVERDGEVSPRAFAAALASAMARALGRMPRRDVTPGDAYQVAAARAEWALRGEVIAPTGPEWTVVLAEGTGLVPAVGNRVVFVRPVQDIRDVLPWIDRRCQTIGLAAGDDRARSFALEAATRGADRIVSPGRMNLYDQPWDGMFMIDRLVRWVALDL